MMKALQRILNTLLTAALTVALTLGATGCTNHEMPDAGSLLPDTGPGRKITIHASTGQEAGTRVAYDDTQVGATPNKALTWQEGDRLTVVGMAEGAYVNHKDDYEYQGEPGETSGDFVGTEIAGANSWSIYYPNTVNVDTDTGLASLSMEGQTQTANGSTDHLRNYLLLAATDVKDINHFSLKMQNSIMKFVISGVPSKVGKLRKLIWEVETEGGTKSATLDYTGEDINLSLGSIPLTVYIAFDPSVMKVKNNGKFTVKLLGDINYQTSTTIFGGKTYAPGKRYTATINSDGFTWEIIPSSMQLVVEPTNMQFNIPFPTDGRPSPAYITVNWGDGTVTRVPKGTPLDGKEGFSHEYLWLVVGQPLTITITTDQLDETQPQIPEFNFKYRTGDGNKAKLISIKTSLLNTGATDFSSCFEGCTALQNIPKELFEKNTLVEDFSGCFRNCTVLQSIPARLFDKNTQATHFSNCFSNCTALQSIPDCSFSSNTIDVSGCFSSCTGVKSISESLFHRCLKATNFSNCFDVCTALQSIPHGFFKNRKEKTDYSYCFRNCVNLVLNKNIFDGDGLDRLKNGLNFTSFFENVGSNLQPGEGGEAPELWTVEYKSRWKYGSCFLGATNVTNWGKIPDTWKGW